MAGPVWELRGVQDAQRQLSKALDGIDGNTSVGLDIASQLVEDAAKELTSIDKKDLIRTTFIDNFDSDDEHLRSVGYTAPYAAAVHEMPEDTNWQKPGAENKFLEKAIIRNISKIVNIIKTAVSKTPL